MKSLRVCFAEFHRVNNDSFKISCHYMATPYVTALRYDPVQYLMPFIPKELLVLFNQSSPDWIKKEKPLRTLRLCGEIKDLYLTDSTHSDEVFINTPTYPHSKAWTFSPAEGLWNKFKRVTSVALLRRECHCTQRRSS